MSASSKIPFLLSKANICHQKGITGKGITIAVLDSGLFPHPDFSGNRIIAFKDFISDHSLPYDDYSHGTHVTGIIASSRIGIAPQSNIISLKVLDRNGNGSSDAFIRSIQWILENQAHFQIQIVNISIGGNASQLKYEKHILNLWVAKLWESGITVCCSAGNMGPAPDSITVPGSCREVITVGSYDGKNYSSAGPLLPYITKPELVAPGTNIISTCSNGGYSKKSGTSMSVPFVSGACPYLTNEQIKMRLMESAVPIPSLPYNVQGAGILNLPHLLNNTL